jgi:hypothetical protein
MERASNWLRALLEAWADGLAGCEVVEGARWCFERVAPPMAPERSERAVGWTDDALPVRVEVDDGIRIQIAAWEHILVADDEGAREAADLVAAALFGRIRVEVHGVGERWLRQRVELHVGDRWVEIASLRRVHLAVWKRPVVSRLRNALEPPAGVRLRRGGTLPFAPWVGILDDPEEDAAPRELVVNGELDLHPFQPREVAAIVREYIDACLERGIVELRIVHGKGIGNLRRTVHALLDKHPAVAGYRLGGSGGGGWGATVVDLKRPGQSR